MTTFSRKKTPVFFECKKCLFTTSNKYDYKKHLLTAKHKNTTEYNASKKNKEFYCECGKVYAYRGSLHNHKKKCVYINNNSNTNSNNNSNNNSNSNSNNNSNSNDTIVKEDINQIEIINKLIDENKKLQEHIYELIPKIGNTIINNKVDINVFLNEECKDALTLSEFINKINISLDDLNITKSKGLSEGVSNILIENMNRLSLYERPVHCTDLKRETIYIKLDKPKESISNWLKDDDKKIFKEAIKYFFIIIF